MSQSMQRLPSLPPPGEVIHQDIRVRAGEVFQPGGHHVMAVELDPGAACCF